MVQSKKSDIALDVSAVPVSGKVNISGNANEMAKREMKGQMAGEIKDIDNAFSLANIPSRLASIKSASGNVWEACTSRSVWDIPKTTLWIYY